MNDAVQANGGPDTGGDFSQLKTHTLGMWLFLVSLATLFAATMVGYLLILVIMKGRTIWVDESGQEVDIPPMPDLPHLPILLWASTVVILASSATIQWALAGVRKNDQASLRRGMGMTFGLGLVFLALQIVCWLDWIDRAVDVLEEHQTYRFAVMAFLVLSMLHAAHILGGLFPMGVVLRRAMGGRYSVEAHMGVHHVALYWHFLDVVWLIMFAALLLFT